MAIKFILTFVVRMCQTLNETCTVISIDSLLVSDNKYYLQVHLDNCAYKIVKKPMTDYLDENIFEY